VRGKAGPTRPPSSKGHGIEEQDLGSDLVDSDQFRVRCSCWPCLQLRCGRHSIIGTQPLARIERKRTRLCGGRKWFISSEATDPRISLRSIGGAFTNPDARHFVPHVSLADLEDVMPCHKLTLRGTAAGRRGQAAEPARRALEPRAAALLRRSAANGSRAGAQAGRGQRT